MDHFTRGSLVFPVLDSGPRAGEPVVLLHGFPQTASSYDGVAARLNVTGFRTVIPTQRGYTGTARPGPRRNYRMAELVGDVVALIDALGVERVHLVGHDWGGAVAWAVAGLWPDRIKSLTVLSTPHPAALGESLVRSSQARKSWYMLFFQLPVVPERMMRTSLARQLHRSGLAIEMAQDYARAMSTDDSLTGALNWYRGLPFSLGTKTGTITVPTTYVWGRTDFALGQVAAERTGAHVSADYRFVVLEAGHWLPESQPAAVSDAIIARIAGG